VDGVIEGISSVLFTSLFFEGVIEYEMISVTTVDSDIFRVSATRVVLNCVEIVGPFELLNVSVVALSATCDELVISKDVSFGPSVVELYSVEIKLAGGDETILYSVEMLSWIVDEIVGKDEVKMMGAVKFSGIEVEDVSLLIVETLYSLLVDVSTTSDEARASSSSVTVGMSVNSLVDLVWLDDWRSFETDGSVEILPPIETEASVDVELKLLGTVKFRVIFSILEIVEVEDASLLVAGKLFLWTLDISRAIVEFTVVTLSCGVDENIVSYPIVLDDFFVKSVKLKYVAFNETVELSFDFFIPDISVKISSPIVDWVSEAVIEDEVTTVDSDIFGVLATNVGLNGAEFVELFELFNVSVVVLSAICVELVISKDVSFGRSVVELYSVEIKLTVGEETILFAVEMLSCVVDEIAGDDEVKMMSAVKFIGVEVEDVSLLIVETLYSLMVDISTTSVETRGSTSSVIVGVSVDSLVDLVWLADWRSFETDGSVEILPPIETEASVDVELKSIGTVKFRVIFSILEIMEVEDAPLFVVGKLFLWMLDVSTATVEFTFVTLLRGVDENIVSLIAPIVLDDFFVKSVKLKYVAFNETIELSFDFFIPDTSVKISSPIVDCIMEGIALVLFTSFISEAVIEDEMVSVTIVDSDIFGVSVTSLVLNAAEFAELFKLFNVLVVAVFPISVELVTTKDVSFGCFMIELYSVEIKLAGGDETILFSVWMLCCVVDEIIGDDEVKMMGAVKFSGIEVEDVSLMIVETLYSLMVDVSTAFVEARGSTASVTVGVSVDSLVDLVWLADWRSFETDGSVEMLPPIETEASVDVELEVVGTVKFR
jgi:hypothetical protein